MMPGTIERAADHVWDSVVVGAGPAGSLTAHQLARSGHKVLLVEKSRFPRWKVCGACLGSAGVLALQRAGLGEVLARIGARPISATRLLWRGREVQIPMRGMVAVSRGALDLHLATAARSVGVEVLEGVRASIKSNGRVHLQSGGLELLVDTRSVVQASGLRATEPGHSDLRIDPRSWIGLGVDSDVVEDLPEDELLMIVGSRGYLGRVQTQDGRANWAAAVDPVFLRSRGSPTDAMQAICDEAGVGLALPANGWTGTPALTRSFPAQAGSIFRVGDAAGYVEPITGEGMSWALLGALRLAPIVGDVIAGRVVGNRWTADHRSLFRARRLRCQVVSRTLRSPLALHAAFATLGRSHAVRGVVVRRLIGGAT